MALLADVGIGIVAGQDGVEAVLQGAQPYLFQNLAHRPVRRPVTNMVCSSFPAGKSRGSVWTAHKRVNAFDSPSAESLQKNFINRITELILHRSGGSVNRGNFLRGVWGAPDFWTSPLGSRASRASRSPLTQKAGGSLRCVTILEYTPVTGFLTF